MVQATSTYDPRKLTLLIQKMTPFWPFWVIFGPEISEINILRCCVGWEVVGTTMAGNGFGYFEI